MKWQYHQHLHHILNHTLYFAHEGTVYEDGPRKWVIYRDSRDKGKWQLSLGGVDFESDNISTLESLFMPRPNGELTFSTIHKMLTVHDAYNAIWAAAPNAKSACDAMRNLFSHIFPTAYTWNSGGGIYLVTIVCACDKTVSIGEEGISLDIVDKEGEFVDNIAYKQLYKED